MEKENIEWQKKQAKRKEEIRALNKNVMMWLQWVRTSLTRIS
jgi:hypothetical protein